MQVMIKTEVNFLPSGNKNGRAGGGGGDDGVVIVH